MSSLQSVQSFSSSKEEWCDLITIWSQSNQPKFTQCQLSLLQSVFPTVEVLNARKGAVQDAIVASFDVHDRDVFYMDIPRRRRNTPDKFDPARERKLKLQARIRYILNKISDVIRQFSSPANALGSPSIAAPRRISFSPTHDLRNILIDEITFGAVIGEGSYGTVRVGSWRHARVAIKQLKLSMTNNAETREAQITNFMREAATMAKVCCHNHLVQFIGVVHDSASDGMYFLTAYCSGGSLYSLLFDRAEQLSLFDLSRIATEAAAGILHLHNEHVIHRDIAARNILLDGPTRTVKVSDFGFARECNEDGSGGSTSSSVGPVKWMAPESIKNLEYSIYSDVFSFGVLLFEMFQMQQPWAGVSPLLVIDKVCRQNMRCIINEEKVPASIVSLIESCWCTAANARPTMHAVIELLQAFAISLGHPPEEFMGLSGVPKGFAVDNYACITKNDADSSRGYDSFFESF